MEPYGSGITLGDVLAQQMSAPGPPVRPYGPQVAPMVRETGSAITNPPIEARLPDFLAGLTAWPQAAPAPVAGGAGVPAWQRPLISTLSPAASMAARAQALPPSAVLGGGTPPVVPGPAISPTERGGGDTGLGVVPATPGEGRKVASNGVTTPARAAPTPNRLDEITNSLKGITMNQAIQLMGATPYIRPIPAHDVVINHALQVGNQSYLQALQDANGDQTKTRAANDAYKLYLQGLVSSSSVLSNLVSPRE